MTMFLLCIPLLVGLLLVPALGWADYPAGEDAYNRGDYATALNEWRSLAAQGDAGGQNGLGLMYVKGQGVFQDSGEAAKWFRLAADQRYASAQYNLGLMYDKGQGVPQDNTVAVKWYRLAADQGYAKAQNNLAAMYYSGKGVLKDYVFAHMWANLAASQGQKIAVILRDAVERVMIPQQMAEAQRLAREWKPKGK